ncbi:MAG: hypothetical protein LBN27_09710 [Prevotellaceae bacterium]|jgi:hypothetical protein|nr:hypothetical protein [Prevotellaceae bacterium]
MKPIKNLEPAAKWILRFSLAAYIICLYFNEVKTFDFKSVTYIINLIYTLFAVLLLLGGISKNGTLTIISGIVLALISAYKIYVAYSLDSLTNPAVYLFLLVFGVGVFFMSKGNT